LSVGYAELEPFDLETTEAVLRKILTEHDLKAGMFIGAVRVAMTGKAHAPGIFDVIVALGKERTIKRLQSAGHLVRSS
jgi:glutamyl-tRNA synthetase